MKKNIIIVLLAVIIFVCIVIWYAGDDKGTKDLLFSPPPIPSLVAHVTYICKDEKTINANFYKGEAVPVKLGERPIFSGSAKIALSDGRSFDLPQTISADGSRYATGDETFIFWSKGNGALVLENNVEKSYIGCVVLAKDPGGLSKIYLDPTAVFSIRYPEDYLLDASYKYQGFGPGKDIGGVKFIIPSGITEGANLSSFDTGVSVEVIPAVQNCDANLFLSGGTDAKIINDNGGEYSFATTIQGAAGNRYEEKVWAIPEANPCIAVRYLVHSMNIGNYPEGTVSEFDRAALMDQFDTIRHSLTTL
jgi:membrane-bound inhibitor of C-type lysozyme